jgi:hypothetical protein
MLALFYLFVWTAVWMWVVTNRGTWNLILANLAGAASGFIVALTVSAIGSSLFPSAIYPAPENEASKLWQVITTAGALAGVWMWMVRRSRPEHPVLRQLFAGFCAMAAGATTMMVLVLGFH